MGFTRSTQLAANCCTRSIYSVLSALAPGWVDWYRCTLDRPGEAMVILIQRATLESDPPPTAGDAHALLLTRL